jgi:hypothetical protein
MIPCLIKHILAMMRIISGTAKLLLLVMCFVCCRAALFAQCTRQERVYADAQTGSGNVTGGPLAVDGDPLTASTLSAALLAGGASQFLTFSQTIAQGTPVIVKLTPPSGTLNALSSMTLQAYTLNRTTGVRTNVGTPLTSSTLLGLLTSSGAMEVSFNPGALVAYDGVAITLGGLTITTVRMTVYHAYVMRTATTDVACNQVVDYLSGVKATGIDLATSLSKVFNEQLAADNDPTFTTFANMQADAGLLNPLYETVIFKTPSLAGDSLRIVLKDPAVPLLSLTALGGFSIQPYLGQTAAGSAITNTSPLLNLQLLGGGADQQYVLTVPVAASFDRVEISLTGLASVLRRLYIYDVARIAKAPAFNFTVSGEPGSSPVCITRVSNMLYTITGGESCATYRWYNAAGATLLASGPSFTPPITTAGTYTYQVAAQRTGCTNIETKKQLSVTVSALPGPPVLTIQNNP